MTNSAPGPEARLTVRPREMARMLSVSLRTLQGWMARRGLPHTRVNRVVLLDPLAVIKWLQNIDERNTGGPSYERLTRQSGEPVVHADELPDRLWLILREFDTTEENE